MARDSEGEMCLALWQWGHLVSNTAVASYTGLGQCLTPLSAPGPRSVGSIYTYAHNLRKEMICLNMLYLSLTRHIVKTTSDTTDNVYLEW